MPKKRTELRIEILGATFTIQTDESPQYVSTLLDYYKKKVGEVRSSAPMADALKTAVLAGLLLADEVLRKQGTGTLSQEEAEIARLTEKLIQTLDECLVSDSKAHTSSSFE